MQQRLRSFRRWLKYKYMMLMRAKGGASMVAMGFAIGIAVEMFTLPTLGFAFLLIFPLVYILKGNLPAALIGFVIGKLIYLGMVIPNKIVGGWVLPEHMTLHITLFSDWVNDKLNRLLLSNLKLLVGGIIDGTALGVLSYFIVKLSVEAFKAKRKEKRKLRRAQSETGTMLE